MKQLLCKSCQKAVSSISISNSSIIGVVRRCWSTMVPRGVTALSSSNNDDYDKKVSPYIGKMRQPSVSYSHCHYFSSVSSPEVAKFNAMHQDWWDPEKNPLIGMNAIRMQYIRQQVMKYRSVASSTTSESSPSSLSLPPLQGLKALDIGCGGGVACESLVRLGASQVIGLDPSFDLIVAAQQHAIDTSLMRGNNNNTLQYKNMSVEEFLIQHQANTDKHNDNPYYFDIICLLEVLEHVSSDNMNILLMATSKLLHPTRGLLFISTMSPTPLSYALTIVGAEYIMRYLPIGTHDFNLYKSPKQVQDAMNVAGTNLEQVNVTGMILSRPPPIMGIGSWNWKLDSNNTEVNWIGTYRIQNQSNE